MASAATLNPNPIVYSSIDNLEELRKIIHNNELNEDVKDPIDELEVFDIFFYFF